MEVELLVSCKKGSFFCCSSLEEVPQNTSLLVGAGSVEGDIGAGAPVDPGVYRLKCDSSTSYQNFVLEVFWQNTSIRSPIFPCYLVSQWSISSQNLVSSIYSSVEEIKP